MRQLRTSVLFAAILWATGSFAEEPGSNEAAVIEHAPKIVCDELTYNFGEMDSSRDVEHTFILRNEGDLTLEIRNVRPACGCTVANISQNTIPPGGQAEVSTRLSLRGRQGAQHKSISVESNDPKQPTLLLYLEGVAVEEMRVQPSQLFFGRITTDSCVTGLVEIAINNSDAVMITKTETWSTNLVVKAERVPDGKMIRVLVTTRPPLPLGTLRTTLQLETTHQKYPVINIPVSAFVVGDITFAPEELPVIEKVDQPASRYVLVRSETGKPFQIAAVEVPLSIITYKIQPVDSGGYQVELSNIPSTRDVEGKSVRIKTDLPDAQDIVIPFRFIPAPPSPQPTQ